MYLCCFFIVFAINGQKLTNLDHEIFVKKQAKQQKYENMLMKQQKYACKPVGL